MDLDREEQWCLDAVAALIERAGFETFVSAPLLDASARWFPEGGEVDARRTATVARRLLDHAGLGDTRLRLIDYSPTHQSTTVDVPEILVGHCTRDEVEIEAHVLGRPADQIGVLSHEVGLCWWSILQESDSLAAPFREHDAADDAVSDADRARGSIAALFLGFGVPATNASEQARHGGYSDGYLHTTEWTIATSGGLSSRAMCFLFAIQLVVRDRRDEEAAVLRALEANQRHDVGAFVDSLRPERDRLLERLRLPSSSSWPEVDATRRDIDRDSIELVEPIDPSSLRAFNRGAPVFRVRGRRTASFAFFGALPGLAAFSLSVPTGLAVVAAGAGIGAAVGRGRLYFKCSDPGCERLLGRDDRECSGCQGHIAGEIAHARDRLEALEALEAGSDADATE